MVRWSIPAALAAAGLALLAAIYTPEPGSTAAQGFEGWPRLALYALAGLLLAFTAPEVCISYRPRPRRARARGYILLAIGIGAGVLISTFNAQRLRANSVDPLGPPVWLAAMLVLLAYTLFPQVRRIGWLPLWPEASGLTRSRLVPPLILIALLAFSAAIRLPFLADIPQGINPDEGDRTSTAFDVINGVAPPSWFDSGWFFINMIYFRVLAVSLMLFGQGIAGGRMLTALCGIGFVAAIAWIGVRNFGWRTGLVATAFASAMMMTVQHSRLITEAGPTALLWAISIGAFLEGARTGRLWAWALAGTTGGLGLYFYPSARLWAAGAVLTVLVILIFLRDRRLLPGVLVAAIASLTASGPFLVHLWTHQDELVGRYAQTAVLDPHNQERLAYLHPPEPLFNLLALQFERTIGMFDRYPDGGGFLPTGNPIFGVPLAQLTLIGAVFLLVRSVRDMRLAVLSIWFWLGLSGVAFTVETPDYLRSVGMLPSLCFVLAIPLLDLVDRVPALRLPQHQVLAGVVPGVAAFVLLAPEVVGYFNTFRTMPGGWGPETREGRIIEELGAAGPVYSLEMNEHMVSSGWVRLLAPRAERGRMPNPGRELPVLPPVAGSRAFGEQRPDFYPSAEQGFSFVFSPDPNQRPYVPMLQELYPQAEVVDAGDGRRALKVSPRALAATRGVNVVDDVGGATYVVDRFGQVPPQVSFPADLTWWAGVRLPRNDTYRIALSAPGSAEVRLDGVAATGDSQASMGVHLLEVQASVGAADQRVGLAIDSIEISPEQTYRLMDAPWGLTARLNRSALANQAANFLDAAVAMAFFDPEVGFVITPNNLVWSGTLVAPRTGVYRMAFGSEDTMHLQVDGVPVDVVTVKPEGWQSVGTGSLVRLTEGAHRVMVTLDISHGGRDLARWNWIPPLPNGAMDTASEWSVVPPHVLRPDSAAVSATARPAGTDALAQPTDR